MTSKGVLVALSGGVDSVALLKTLSIVHEDKVMAAYYHHGESHNSAYRDQARMFCQNLCSDLGVPFFSLTSPALESLQAESEEAYRHRRYQVLEDCLRKNNLSVLALGHHRDDLLETRLMRLIRGTGLQGLKAMEILKGAHFRPLLENSKSELQAYVISCGLTFVEDPTNSSLDPFRNWIRQQWLPALEARQEGASASLARSLETIASEVAGGSGLEGNLLQSESKEQGLSRAFYLTLSESQQRRLLAQYLYLLGKRDFSRSHLEEIQKRLDNSQKVITFKVGGCLWNINAEQIKVQILE